MNIMFMGTSDFAVTALNALCEGGFKPSAVISQPDRPRNRGVVTPTPVKAAAQEHGIEVFTPETIKNGELSELLEKYVPDVAVVVAYGKILPKYVLDFPKYGCVNIHASLLPAYRGAAPINFALIKGEKKTGVTTMFMDEGLDTGDMIYAREALIDPSEDFGTLHDRLARMGGELIVETLKALEGGYAPRTRQEGESCYAPMIDNSLRKIDFNKTTDEIVNLIRGLSPVPTAFTRFEGRNVKIYRAAPFPGEGRGEPGEICDDKRLIVKTKDGLVEILSVQPESKKPMSGEDFLRGHKQGRFE